MDPSDRKLCRLAVIIGTVRFTLWPVNGPIGGALALVYVIAVVELSYDRWCRWRRHRGAA